jgi:hypothetical protein
MSIMNASNVRVRVTALALAFVLPTTALAGPPEAVVPEGPQPIGNATPVAPPPPTVVQVEPDPTALDDRALLKKKASPGIAMASVGFTVFLGSYLFTQLFVDFEAPGKAEVEAYAVPIVGPFIMAGKGEGIAALSGLFQLTGFAVGVAGIALIAKATRDHRRQRLSLGGSGLTLRF